MNLMDLFIKIGVDDAGVKEEFANAQKAATQFGESAEASIQNAKKPIGEYGHDVMSLAQTYKSQGMTMSDAMKRAYSEIDKSQYETAENSKKDSKTFLSNWLGASKALSGAVGKGLATAAKIGGVAIGALAAGTAAFTTALVKGTAQLATYGDNIDKMSQKMGMSAQAYQEWDAILQHSGASIDGMQRAMMGLSIAAEKGSASFEKVGISAEQLGSMSQEELFAATIKGLQGMEEGTERAALAQELLGGAAKELGPLLNTSAEETEAMRQRVHELGGVMSDEAVKASAQFADSLQDMQTAFGGLKNNMMSGFMPSLTKVMDGLTELFSGNTDKGIGMVTEGIQAFAGRLTEVIPQLIEVGTSLLGPVVDAIGEQLPIIIEKLIPSLMSGAAKLVLALVKALPGIMSALWDGIKAVGKQLLPVLESVFGGVAGWFGEKFQAAKAAVQAAFQSIGDFFAGVWADIVGVFEDAKNVGVNVVNDILTGIQSVWDSIVSWVSGAWDKVKSFFTIDVSFLGGGKSHAIGNDYVPYNNYPALLHRGEAVLTAREADEWRRGKGSGGREITNVFNFNGVSQSDLDYIVGYVNRGLA